MLLLGWPHTASQILRYEVRVRSVFMYIVICGTGELICLYNAKVGIEFEFSRIIRVAGWKNQHSALYDIECGCERDDNI